jgi:hypothetical protein
VGEAAREDGLTQGKLRTPSRRPVVEPETKRMRSMEGFQVDDVEGVVLQEHVHFTLEINV